MCGFVLSWCFAWVVWLLCACIVRRIKGLLRVLPFVFALCLCFCSSLSCFFACPLVLCLSFLSLFVGCSWVSFWVVVSFSLTDDQTKREGAKCCPLRPRLSCCGLLLLFGFNSQPFPYLVKVEAEYIIQLYGAYSLRI